MDNLEWSENIAAEIVVTCQIEVTINIDLWIETNGVLGLPTNITNKLCPDGCNNRGTCENGKLSKHFMTKCSFL